MDIDIRIRKEFEDIINQFISANSDSYRGFVKRSFDRRLDDLLEIITTTRNQLKGQEEQLKQQGDKLKRQEEQLKQQGDKSKRQEEQLKQQEDNLKRQEEQLKQQEEDLTNQTRKLLSKKLGRYVYILL
jgi:septal ring factor EnvC (AmiA/AmiB activator)